MNGQEKWRFDGCKLLWHMDRVHQYYRDGKRIAPIHMDIGATKLCNAKCVYCYGIYQEMSRDIIPADILIRLLSDAPHLGVKSLTITGDGEPTLNPALYDAVQAGFKAGLDIGIATNGIALDIAKLAILLGTCTWLRFNLSGYGEEGYKSIHGVPQWERVQANILLASELKKEYGYKCTIGLQMVLIPSALPHVIPISKFAIKNGIDYFVIKQYSDPGCSLMSQFNLDWYNNTEVLNTLYEAEQMSTGGTKIVPKWGMIKSMGVRPYDHCMDCPLIFQVSGNSKCYPCGYLFNNEEYCYGDLKKQTLQEIITSKRYWDIIDKMAKFDVHKDCHGNCRHDFTNEFIHNYLRKPDHINFI